VKAAAVSNILIIIRIFVLNLIRVCQLGRSFEENVAVLEYCQVDKTA